MAATMRHIKNLKNNNITVTQALLAFVFGNSVPKTYDSSAVYNRGDMILSFNSVTNRNEVLQCTTDNTTGAYNVANWTSNIASDVITGKTVNTKMVQLKTAQPDDASNLIWFKQVKVKTPLDASKII